MPCISQKLAVLVAVAASIVPALADPNDWVNIDYVVNQAKALSKDSTLRAQNTIIGGASSTAKEGPWTIVPLNKGMVPPSGDLHDYMSWAPYHWPNCNWCGQSNNDGRGRQHAVHNGTELNPDDEGYDSDEPSSSPDEAAPEQMDTEDPFPDGGLWDAMDLGRDMTKLDQALKQEHSARKMVRRHRRRELPSTPGEGLPFVEDAPVVPLSSDDLPVAEDVSSESLPEKNAILQFVSLPPTPLLPTSMTEVDPAITVASEVSTEDIIPQLTLTLTSTASTSTSTDYVYSATPVQAASKTQKPKKDNSQKPSSSCTPSPTKSMAPSATWTTCPYVGRDGQANPDVRSLAGPGAINKMSQSLIYNGVAYALSKKQVYCQNVVAFVNTFFIDPQTRMKPNLNFGQMVRGPGPSGVSGTYTGILDMRGMVRLINAVSIIKSVGCSDWTSKMDGELTKWMTQYSVWLESNELAKKACKSANNHGTFCASQLAAVKYFIGDTTGAVAVLQQYFKNQFLDQVAQSGEQPFEAVRTRPFHYRCFNIEAMIMNAKLGDQMGLNFWDFKSKYGATIEKAVLFAMSLDPKNEDSQGLVPFVAAVSAAYGDPEGKYASYMKKQMDNYESKPFYFYSQTNALSKSPAASRNGQKPRRTLRWARDDGDEEVNVTSEVNDVKNFECPAVFMEAAKVELEIGLYITCEDVRAFY